MNAQSDNFVALTQVVIGGGQEASQVTMTSTRAGKFEAKFFHKVRHLPVFLSMAMSHVFYLLISFVRLVILFPML